MKPRVALRNPRAQVFASVSGPSFCWHCRQKLAQAPRRYGRGTLYGCLVADIDGNAHRVHATCVKSIENVKLIPRSDTPK